MSNKAWKIIPRPLLESILNNHASQHRVPQLLFLHGPRGVGKTTLILDRLFEDWNKGRHVTGYVDFGRSVQNRQSSPWVSWSSTSPTPPSLTSVRLQLEHCLEEMVEKGVRLGCIGSNDVFATLNRWHGLNTALRRILQNHATIKTVDKRLKASTSVLWSRAVLAISSRLKTDEIDAILGFDEKENGITLEEKPHFREAILSLRLAKEVIEVHQSWRANAIADLNRTGGYSRSLAHSCTDWPYLLVELLSVTAETDYFQPKLVINNIEILRDAVLTDDSSVSASMYHDSFLWRLIALGVNEMSLPIILLTSDSYYSYQASADFGYPDVFISRETFGWTPKEAKMHLVTDYFSESEWMLIMEVLGPNPRHLSELYALKQSRDHPKIMQDINGSTFEDIVEAYLAYLQVTVVNPAMDLVLLILQKFAADAQNGKISKDLLRFGAPWRHPPRTTNPTLRSEWAKIQLLDFIQSLVNAEFGINYFADRRLEFLEDPCVTAMMEVGLLYKQRDPSFIRPVSRGIQRCLVRWLVQERMQMNFWQSLKYRWQRVIRGRSYRHLMREVGYK
ncbi:hypothetical protein GIB67_032757 [Kingdonia uniflora]|uniref:Uncharacterized protein n=1 Tax=Kingdonia uniflora TaxID=39325 RepID=A0A7J7MWJ5_9MAGN|nr:hypothetical protein GIB67_032757 [Kingdonia uniflora]